jgi:P27 family predicted phage terminase small subunit
LQDLTPPSWLDAAAAAVWNETAPKLRAARVLTEIDAQLLAMGCVSIAQYRQSVQRTGSALVKTAIKEDKEGNPYETGEQINPWFIVQSMSFKQAMAVFREFGMSPAARTRIAIQPQGDLFGDNEKSAGYF